MAVFLLTVTGIAWFRDRWRTRGQTAGANDAAVERRFKNVFAMVTQDRREMIIRGYMEAKGVGRIQAMARPSKTGTIGSA